MKNKGFTLIELLAVIALIGLVGTVGISSLIRIRKNTNIKLAKEMENDIKVAGENMFSYEKISGGKGAKSFNKTYNELNENSSIYIKLSALKDRGYLKTDKLKNPSKDDETCIGFLKITKKTSSGPEFKGYINCRNLHKTSDYPNDYTSNNSNSDDPQIDYQDIILTSD